MTTNTEQVRRQYGMIACFGILLLFGTAAIVVGTITTYGSSHQEQEILLLSHVHFRHGDRAPLYVIPTDKRNQRELWKNGMTQLTDEGKKQAHELGRWLRERYSSLLPTTYFPDDILVKSTDKDRTLMTAMSVLAGLYPILDQSDAPFGMQLIPVHTAPEGCDTLIADNKPCPRYYSLRAKIWNSTEVQCIMDKHSKLLKYLSAHSGIPKVGIHDATDYIYDPLFVQRLHGVELPAWTKSVDAEVLDSLTILEYMIMPAFTTELKRLQTGNLLSEIVTHMLLKRNGDLTPDRKMFMYSGHDSTVGPLMHSLGIYDAFQVPYVGTLAIDLVVDQHQSHFVKIFYRNSTAHEPFLLTIPGCEPSCPLDKFVELTKHLIAQDWKKECSDTDVSNSVLDYTIPTIGNMAAWIDCFQATHSG